MTKRNWSWIILGLTVLFAASPYLSSGFGGFTRDQFPVQLDHWPAQPAGWAFSIWGVIYGWLIVSSVYGVWKRQVWTFWNVTRPALAVSLGVGVFWIAAANSYPPLALAMILIMAATAIYAMLRAYDGDPWTLSGPLGLYAGWLTAASGVAIAVNASGYGLVDPKVAALVALSLVVIVGLTVQTLRPRVYSYTAAIVWALIGVIAANFTPEHWPTALFAATGIACFLVRGWQLHREPLAAPAII